MEVNIDEPTLKAIAQETGGRYFRATSGDKLKEIYTEIDELEKTRFNVFRYNKRTENSPAWMDGPVLPGLGSDSAPRLHPQPAVVKHRAHTRCLPMAGLVLFEIAFWSGVLAVGVLLGRWRHSSTCITPERGPRWWCPPSDWCSSLRITGGSNSA